MNNYSIHLKGSLPQRSNETASTKITPVTSEYKSLFFMLKPKPGQGQAKACMFGLARRYSRPKPRRIDVFSVTLNFSQDQRLEAVASPSVIFRCFALYIKYLCPFYACRNPGSLTRNTSFSNSVGEDAIWLPREARRRAASPSILCTSVWHCLFQVCFLRRLRAERAVVHLCLRHL